MSKTDSNQSTPSPPPAPTGATANASAAIWLLKSADRILGPVGRDEVQRRLIARELTIFDEVIRPGSRWRYIRDEPDFAQIIDEVRRTLLSTREDTEVQTSTVNLNDLEETKTVTDVGASEFVREGEATEKGPRDARRRASEPGTKAYGLQNENRIQVSGAREAKLLWGVFAVLVAIGAGLFVFTQFGQPGGRSRDAYNQLVTQAREARLAGDINKSLERYREADRLRQEQRLEPNSMAVLELSALRLEYAGESVIAKRAAEEVLASVTDTTVKAQAQNVLALASIRSEELSEARRLLTDQHLADPASAYNYAYVLMRSQSPDLTQATSVLRPLTSSQPQMHEARVLLAMALLRMGEQQVESRQDAAVVLGDLIDTGSVFEFEASVLMAYTEMLMNDRARALQQVSEALVVDPWAWTDQIPNVFLFRQAVAPGSLVEFCQRLQQRLPAESTRALLALCLARAGESGSAIDQIEGVVGSRPQDWGLQAVKAAVLMMANGRSEDARSLISMVRSRDPNQKLALIAMGRHCRDVANFDCEKMAWDRLQLMAPIPTIALLGQARIYIKDGKKGDARTLLEQVRRRSQDVRGLNELWAQVAGK